MGTCGWERNFWLQSRLKTLMCPKIHSTEQMREILASGRCDIDLKSRIHKHLLKLSFTKKGAQRTWKDILPKKTTECPVQEEEILHITVTRTRHVETEIIHCFVPTAMNAGGKWSERMTSVGKDVRRHLCSAYGNVYECSYYGKQCHHFLNNKNRIRKFRRNSTSRSILIYQKKGLKKWFGHPSFGNIMATSQSQSWK